MLVRSLVLTSLVLAGCASKGPVVEARGAAVPTAGLFRISSLRPEAPPRAELLVAESLKALGLREATGAEPATYSVQVTYSDRAPTIGAFLPVASGEPDWRVMAQKRRPLSFHNPRGAHALGIRIVEAGSGKETSDIRVSGVYRKPPAEGGLATLVTAAFGPPPMTKP